MDLRRKAAEVVSKAQLPLKKILADKILISFIYELNVAQQQLQKELEEHICILDSCHELKRDIDEWLHVYQTIISSNDKILSDCQGYLFSRLSKSSSFDEDRLSNVYNTHFLTVFKNLDKSYKSSRANFIEQLYQLCLDSIKIKISGKIESIRLEIHDATLKFEAFNSLPKMLEHFSATINPLSQELKNFASWQHSLVDKYHNEAYGEEITTLINRATENVGSLNLQRDLQSYWSVEKSKCDSLLKVKIDNALSQHKAHSNDLVSQLMGYTTAKRIIEIDVRKGLYATEEYKSEIAKEHTLVAKLHDWKYQSEILIVFDQLLNYFEFIVEDFSQVLPFKEVMDRACEMSKSFEEINQLLMTTGEMVNDLLLLNYKKYRSQLSVTLKQPHEFKCIKLGNRFTQIVAFQNSVLKRLAEQVKVEESKLKHDFKVDFRYSLEESIHEISTIKKLYTKYSKFDILHNDVKCIALFLKDSKKIKDQFRSSKLHWILKCFPYFDKRKKNILRYGGIK